MMIRNLILFIVLNCALASIIDRRSRYRRQTLVNSNAETNGSGDNVDTDASSYHFKDENGIGMNVTSLGNASGKNATNVENSVGGSVGNNSLAAAANVGSSGDNSSSSSDIFAIMQSEKRRLEMNQESIATGSGDTFAKFNANGRLDDGSQNLTGSHFGVAGGTGSEASKSEVRGSQTLSFDSLISKLAGSANAEGKGNAQSNLDMFSGSKDNNMAINGMMSGQNSNSGDVYAQVNGNGEISDESVNIYENMYGKVYGSGNSSLVGAESINSTYGDAKLFGNSNFQGNGDSALSMNSDLSQNNETASGNVVINNSARGNDTYLSGSDGIRTNSSEGENYAIGNGYVKGIGEDKNSNATQYIKSSQGDDGSLSVLSSNDAAVASLNGQDSIIDLYAKGNIVQNSDYQSAIYSNANGTASGDESSIEGSNNAFASNNGTVKGGAKVSAKGKGKGKSSAKSNVNVRKNKNGTQSENYLYGSATAIGDNTSVQSLSEINELFGYETYSNHQIASGSSKGSSSASASNSGYL
ncbi:unnamed protein product [Caenorhabditis angaria]|uniref:Uncharacterized protein n=1 Tax=Caenorhabditis angaria TaxID=860376 RepID=A0A9P1J5Z3_9PELO|nr:unnamed protein product [Caenorhabditis angaria]